MTDAIPRLDPRPSESHKGNYGRVLLVGGSLGMTGSISLSGQACLRAGAGLVTLATPRGSLATVAGRDPNYMTLPLGEDDDGRFDGQDSPRLESLRDAADVVAVGPGLGQSESLAAWTRQWYAALTQTLVVDADGLNNLAGDLAREPAGPRILTPHPGEFARLCQVSTHDRAELEQTAIRWASEQGVVLVLKGHRTLITDGQRSAHNPTGNPGMATGGCGDVLTGIVAALAAQGLPAWEAARAACYVHGLAGDLAAESLGQVSMIASDLITWLPQAIRQWLGEDAAS